MAKILENGDYPAISKQQSLYEAESGALVLAFEFETTGEKKATLMARQTLVTKDGTVQTKTVDRMKSVFGWDGQDPFWFVDNDLSQIPVSITVENEMYDPKDGKTAPYEVTKVAWINPPGGHAAAEMPAVADRKNVLAKYGAKFRALAGGSPVAAPKAKPTTAQAPPAAPQPDLGMNLPPPTPEKAKEAKSGGPEATMEEAWNALCAENAGKTREELTVIWRETIGKMGKDQADLTKKDWGKLVLFWTDNIPF